MKKIFIILISLFALTSCRTGKELSHSSKQTVIREKDTVVYSKPDSAGLVALIKCDSLGNAYLAEIVKLKSGRSTRPQVKVVGKYIYLDCVVDSMAVYVLMHRLFELNSDSTYIEKPVNNPRPVSRFENFLNKAIFLLIGAVIGVLILLLIKIRN